MDIKILTSIPSSILGDRDYYLIGTHDGIFHSDEVVAISILYLLHPDKKIRVVRTRDNNILAKCNICVDVGGGEFDHHQKGFNLTRSNGIRYASAGLVWKTFGNTVLFKFFEKISLDNFSIYNDGFYGLENVSNISKTIDSNIISLVDCEDNGILASKHCFSYISSYLPSWYESEVNFENTFLDVLNISINILEHEIKQAISNWLAKNCIKDNFRKKCSLDSFENVKGGFSNHILELPCQTIPWTETVIEINNSILNSLSKNIINFVIFPYPTGGWAAQCVPPSLDEKFEQRIPFPKEWAGHTKELPAVSNVPDATFCHNGCFFARAETKKGIIQMCMLAMNY